MKVKFYLFSNNDETRDRLKSFLENTALEKSIEVLSELVDKVQLTGDSDFLITHLDEKPEEQKSGDHGKPCNRNKCQGQDHPGDFIPNDTRMVMGFEMSGRHATDGHSNHQAGKCHGSIDVV